MTASSVLVAVGGSSSAPPTSAGGSPPNPPPGNTAGDGGSHTGTTAQSLEIQLATAECTFRQRCDGLLFTSDYADLADCVARNAERP